jgi:hypothetical protein
MNSSVPLQFKIISKKRSKVTEKNGQTVECVAGGPASALHAYKPHVNAGKHLESF